MPTEYYFGLVSMIIGGIGIIGIIILAYLQYKTNLDNPKKNGKR